MKLSKEVGLYLDIYKQNSDKIYFAEHKGESFYGKGSMMLNTKLLTNDLTLEILQLLEMENISENIVKSFDTIDEENVYTFDSFNRFNSIGTMKEVGIGRKAIGLKRFDEIKKILADHAVTIKIGDYFVFYVGSIPFLICTYSMLDMQTSLLN